MVGAVWEDSVSVLIDKLSSFGLDVDDLVGRVLLLLEILLQLAQIVLDKLQPLDVVEGLLGAVAQPEVLPLHHHKLLIYVTHSVPFSSTIFTRYSISYKS